MVNTDISLNKICNEISIIFPVKNDEKKIIKEFDNLSNFCKKSFNKFEFIFVSNGSNEENIKLLNEKIDNNKFVIHLNYKNSGKGFAIREGLKVSNYKLALLIDSDFSVKIENLYKFFSEYNKPYADFTIGSRKLKDSNVLNTPAIRLLSGSIYTFLVKTLLNIKISDTQCGFKLINKEKFTNVINFISNEFSYDVELFILAKIQNITVYEIPVEYIHSEESSVSLFKDSLLMFLKLIYFKFFYFIKKKQR